MVLMRASSFADPRPGCRTPNVKVLVTAGGRPTVIGVPKDWATALPLTAHPRESTGYCIRMSGVVVFTPYNSNAEGDPSSDPQSVGRKPIGYELEARTGILTLVGGLAGVTYTKGTDR